MGAQLSTAARIAGGIASTAGIVGAVMGRQQQRRRGAGEADVGQASAGRRPGSAARRRAARAVWSKIALIRPNACSARSGPSFSSMLNSPRSSG